MAKPVGAPSKKIYQLRSQFDNKCITTETPDEGSVLNVRTCNKKDEQLFSLRQLAGKIVFASISIKDLTEATLENITSISLKDLETITSIKDLTLTQRKELTTSTIDKFSKNNNIRCISTSTDKAEKVSLEYCDMTDKKQYFTVAYSTGIVFRPEIDLKGDGIEYTIRTKDNAKGHAKDAESCITAAPSVDDEGDSDDKSKPAKNAKLTDCGSLSANKEETLQQKLYLVRGIDKEFSVIDHPKKKSVTENYANYYKILLAKETYPTSVGPAGKQNSSNEKIGNRLYLGNRPKELFLANTKDGGWPVKFTDNADAKWNYWEVMLQNDGSVKFKNYFYDKCIQQKNKQLVYGNCDNEHADEDQKFVINQVKYNLDGGYDN